MAGQFSGANGRLPVRSRCRWVCDLFHSLKNQRPRKVPQDTRKTRAPVLRLTKTGLHSGLLPRPRATYPCPQDARSRHAAATWPTCVSFLCLPRSSASLLGCGWQVATTRADGKRPRVVWLDSVAECICLQNPTPLMQGRRVSCGNERAYHPFHQQYDHAG